LCAINNSIGDATSGQGFLSLKKHNNAKNADNLKMPQMEVVFF